jgi:hypothetical protein
MSKGVKTVKEFPKIVPIQAMVHHNDSSNSLDNLLHLWTFKTPT